MRINPSSDEPIREYVLHREVAWYIKTNYPDVIFLTDLSGIFVSKAVAGKIRDLKCDRGIPDIIILEPRGDWHGLLLELKTVKNTPYKKDGTLKKDEHLFEQNAMIWRLGTLGYKALFCVGLKETCEVIDTYMNA